MIKIDRDYLKWIRPRSEPKAKRRFAEARSYTAMADRNQAELKVLIECDEKLEALQDYRRGDTNLKALRETIREMIKEREAKPYNDQAQRPPR